MKTIREIHLERLLTMARENLALSENAIINLRDDVERGDCQPCKARRIFRDMIKCFEIDSERYRVLYTALYPDSSKNITETKYWVDYYSGLFA